MYNLFNNSNINKQSNYGIQNNTHNFETLQKARQDLMGEIEAVMQYDNHIHNSTDRFAIETWENIKNEELTHVGELLGLINYLDPSQQQFIQDGLNEFNKRINGNNQ